MLRKDLQMNEMRRNDVDQRSIACTINAFQIFSTKKRSSFENRFLHIILSSIYFPWQFLNFLPLPHGQASLRPILGSTRIGSCFTAASEGSK